MNMATKNKIFTRYKDEYYGATRLRKSGILTAVVEVTRMHRKAAIRKFFGLQVRDPMKREGHEQLLEKGTAHTLRRAIYFSM